ncbi:MAG: LEA type 2 family protein [Methanoregula sp.]|jgi:LEA14-like dessication related protein
MPVLHEPVVSLEDLRIKSHSVSSVDLEVMIRVQNINPIGVTLRELPFVVLCRGELTARQIATGNTGKAVIPAKDCALLNVPVRSEKTELIGAFADFVTCGSAEVTIQGLAVIDCMLFGWSVPFTKTMPVTMDQIIAGAIFPSE